MESLYAILGVESSATPDQIKTAWRALAKTHHPDNAARQEWSESEKGQHEARYRQAGGAYTVLGDPAARAEYDRELTAIRSAWVAQRRARAEPQWEEHRRREEESRRRRRQEQTAAGVQVEDLAQEFHAKAVARRARGRELRLSRARDAFTQRRQSEREQIRDFTQRVLAEAMLRWFESDWGLPEHSLRLDD